MSKVSRLVGPIDHAIQSVMPTMNEADRRSVAVAVTAELTDRSDNTRPCPYCPAWEYLTRIEPRTTDTPVVSEGEDRLAQANEVARLKTAIDKKDAQLKRANHIIELLEEKLRGVA